MMEWLLTYAALGLVQLGRELPASCALFRKKKREGVNETTDSLPSVSVVITAKDQGFFLERNLPLVLQQDYPCFEVIVVDNSSTDNTEEVLKRLEPDYRNLYRTFVPNSARYVSTKKLALTMGIRASRYDWIVYTEPDCFPAGKEWLRTLMQNVTEKTDIVLGYSNITPSEHGWPARKLRYHLLLEHIHFLGAALLGKPYTGRGHNMAFRKSMFLENRGYSSLHLEVLRGEDDLLVNNYAGKNNTLVEISPKAMVRRMLPHPKVWRNEALSRLVTGRMHRGALLRNTLSAAVTWSMYLFYLLSAVFIVYGIYNHSWKWVTAALVGLLLNYVVKIFLINRCASLFGERYRFRFSFPLLELGHPLCRLSTKIRRLFHHKSEFYRNSI